MHLLLEYRTLTTKLMPARILLAGMCVARRAYLFEPKAHLRDHAPDCTILAPQAVRDVRGTSVVMFRVARPQANFGANMSPVPPQYPLVCGYACYY